LRVLRKQNSALDASASELTRTIRECGELDKVRREDCDAGANEFFAFASVLDQDQNFVINFQRDKSPPPPEDCSGQSAADGVVTISCYAYRGGAIISNRDQAMALYGSPRPDPFSLGRVVYCDPHPLPVVTHDSYECVTEGEERAPRIGAPRFIDRRLERWTDYRVCVGNVWGYACTKEFSFPSVPSSGAYCGPGSSPYRPCLVPQTQRLVRGLARPSAPMGLLLVRCIAG
jgi:hypothetical protein